MSTTQSHKTFNRVDYYSLGNGYADVFMHKNETQNVDEEGNTIYKADEVYFQIEDSTTKEIIEQNFDFMWEDANRGHTPELTLEEMVIEHGNKIVTLEETLEETLEVLFGGGE